MKKTLITAITMFAMQSFAQLSPKASIDLFPGGYDAMLSRSSMYNPEYSINHEHHYGDFRVRVGGEYKHKKFSAYFDQHVYMDKAAGFTFQPLQAEWYVGASYNIKSKLTVKLEHVCIHPVVSSGTYQYQSRMYGGYNMFSLSYGY